MIQPVMDAKLQVTDASVLATLAASRIDPAFVEFRDYDASRPYSKLYVDRKSDQRILVSSGLPMVRKTDGTRLTPGWEQAGDTYWLRNNLFDGYATNDGQYHISVVNDQPTGPIAGDEAHWIPELYVGGKLVGPKSCTILETDPTNENYHDNVVEWDYVVCKRRIRVIEGRFHGSWIFTRDPGADVRIEYNPTGKLTHQYGHAYDGKGNIVEVQMPAKTCEFIPAGAFKGAVYPVTVGDTGTYYPDAGVTSCDGWAAQIYDGSGEAWATIRGAAGSTAASGQQSIIAIQIAGFSTEATWASLYRSIFLFNTAALAGGTVTAAVMRLFGEANSDNLSISPSVAMYSSNPAANTSVQAGDYDSLGTTLFSDVISYSSLWGTGGYNDFTLNASGMAAVSTSDVTKLGIRNKNYDGDNSEPGWSEAQSYWSVFGQAKGAGYKPTLTVTYTPPITFIPTSSMRRGIMGGVGRGI